MVFSPFAFRPVRGPEAGPQTGPALLFCLFYVNRGGFSIEIGKNDRTGVSF
jgi:hypothetical protein